MTNLGGAVLGPLGRLARAWVDPGRRERTVRLRIGYVAGERIEIELARNCLGVVGKPERYAIIAVLPQF
jgi:hypothetical protein